MISKKLGFTGLVIIILMITAAISPFAKASGDAPWSRHESCRRYPTLFQHDNFGGVHSFFQSSVDNLHSPWNRATVGVGGDSASSVCVPEGWHVELYEHDNYRGNKLTVYGGSYWADLKRNRPNGRDWGDRISSIKVFRNGDLCARVGREFIPASCGTPSDYRPWLRQ